MISDFGSCSHLLESLRTNDLESIDDSGYYRAFIGKGMGYHLVCSDCKNKVSENEDSLVLPLTQSISEADFSQIEKKFELYGLTGEAEVLISKEQRKIQFSYRSLSHLSNQVVLDIQPYYGEGYTQWIAINAAGCLVKINEGSNFVEPSKPLGGAVDFSKPILTCLAPNQRFLAIANTFGTEGCVVNIDKEEICFEFKRGDYHIEHCEFPMDFFERDGKTYFVHATDWNRLDISDLESGKLITDRDWETPAEGQRAKHSLDYFYGSLSISPGFKWIFNSGWAWHPVGMPIVFNLHDWHSKNIWESEDGPSRKTLAQLDYWPSSACWIDDNQLAFDGLEGDFYTSHGLRIIDMLTGNTVKSFAGPSGALFFDKDLFSVTALGFSGWNINTGERIIHDSSFRPLRYHRKTKQFLSLLPKNVLQFGVVEKYS